MTPAGGYKAEEGLDADAFQLPLLFWFTLLSQKHQNMNTESTHLFFTLCINTEYARRAVRPDVSGPFPRPCKYRIQEENELIEVKNLVKDYGGHLAVDHLNFTIEDGQIYGFLGPNGAGKSTTMNIMTGYIGATEGDVLINGHNILEEPEEAKKCIGYLPEMPPLYFDMTVLEYMKFAADLKKIPKKQKDKQIKEVMDMVKITDMKDRLIKNLSKGYRQRVGLAQAILGYPEVIILDEPTVGLDPKQIIEIRDLIKGLKQKHTVILSSHILSEVRAVCDYVLIISHGKLVASDTPDNLERLAAGSNSLLMKVKGEKDTIRKALETIEGVTGVEMSYDSDEKLWKTKLSIQENVDIREKVFYAMAKANCPIYEMQVKRVSLEDVFLELTEGEKKSVGKPESSQWRPVEDRSSEEEKTQEEKTEEPEKASDEKEGDQS